MSTPHSNQEYDIIGSGSATVTNVAKAIDHADFGFSAEQLAAATRAVFSVHSGNAHYCYCGTTPTVDTGHMLQQLFPPQVVMGNPHVNNLAWIREGAVDCIVYVTLECEQGKYTP